ncbi:MAG: zinc ribbon domain-containing protein [Bacteroidales bacterium]|nr:zinc ribbon domain-containing protein [Bacteroidales bacterium]
MSVEMKSCVVCGAEIAGAAKFCTVCGAKQEIITQFEEEIPVSKCQCGNELLPGSKFCTKCGAKVEQDAAAISENTCVCGAELVPNAKFCTKCGKKLGEETPKENICTCGAELMPNAKFCTKCGKQNIKPEEKVSVKEILVAKTPVKEEILVKKQDAPVKPLTTSAPVQPKKKKSFFKYAAIFIIVAVVGTAAYFGYQQYMTGVKKSLLLEQKVTVSDEDQTIAYEDEISVKVPYGLIEQEQTMSIYSVRGLEEIEGLSMLGAYDVTMSSTNEFDGFLEITITYDPADLPNGADAEKDLFCMYLDEKDNEWKALPYDVDASKNQITVYTNHLTTFAPWAVSEQVEPGPMMKVAHVKFPGGKFMSDEEVKKTMETYAETTPGSASAYQEGWSKVSEWFGITAAVGTFAEHGLEMGALQGVNEIAMEVGLGFAMIQCAIDISQGKTGKATLELSKNVYNYYAIKFINTSAINLAFVGVFVIDWSLNKFIQEAISGRVDIYQKAYDLYYKDKRKNEKINNPWWYKKLKKTMKSVKNPADASADIQKLIHDYVWEFWSDETVVAAYMDKVTTGSGFTGGGYLSEQLKKDISDVHFASIIKTLNETNVFERIVKELRLDMQGKLYDKLCAIQKKMNQVHQIKVVLKKDDDSEEYDDVGLSGLPIEFIISNNAHGEQWKGKSNKDGEMDFSCTLLGYMDAGAPKTVEVTVEGPAGKEEVFSGELKLAEAGKTTIVEITIGSPALEGVWSVEGKCTFADLSASLQYFDNGADIYGVDQSEMDAAKKETANAMIGKKYPLPDVDFDMIANIWKISRSGKTYTITSPTFNDKSRIGGSEYVIEFTGKDTFTGTMESWSGFGGEYNVFKYDITGKRKR